MESLTLALLSALIVSLVSLAGASTLYLTGSGLKKVTNLLLSLAAGAMLGNALLHILPHSLDAMAHHEPAAIVQPTSTIPPAAAHEHDTDHDHHHHDHDHDLTQQPAESNTASAEEEHHHDHAGLNIFALVLTGFFAFFAFDLALLSRGRSDDEHGVRPLGYLVLLGDGLENFMDGIVIGAAYLIDPAVGIATTIAVFLHEIPMELGDYAVLTHAGFSRKKALLLNFASAIVNTVGVVLAIVIGSNLSGFSAVAGPFAAGAFLYLAGTGLLPQLRTHTSGKEKLVCFAMTVLGVVLMALILLLE